MSAFDFVNFRGPKCLWAELVMGRSGSGPK